MADSPRPRSPGNAGEPSNVGAAPNAGRRRLLQAGISAAPVIMTVASRPVLAQGAGGCPSPSGFVSGNVSNVGMGPPCMGHGLAFWNDYQNNPWPPGYYPIDVTGPPPQNATKFSPLFSPDLNPTGKTFLDVLLSTESGPPYVARLCVAAFLNVAAGFTPPTVLTTATIQHIWHEYATTSPGQFHPTLTAVWNETEIIDYLLTTMPG